MEKACGQVAEHEAGRRAGTENVLLAVALGAEVLARLPGIAAPTGSACYAVSVALSPDLAAMGVPPEEGMSAVRFSLGRTTTWEELEEVLTLLRAAG